MASGAVGLSEGWLGARWVAVVGVEVLAQVERKHPGWGLAQRPSPRLDNLGRQVRQRKPHAVSCAYSSRLQPWKPALLAWRHLATPHLMTGLSLTNLGPSRGLSAVASSRALPRGPPAFAPPPPPAPCGTSRRWDSYGGTKPSSTDSRHAAWCGSQRNPRWRC